MSPPRPVKEIFADALELPEGERGPFLERECRGDAALRARVERLLDARSGGQVFFRSPTATLEIGTDPPVREKPGTRIGPYKLLQQIGEGGFGVVFMAEQTEPIVRRVALKIIKLGMDTRQVIARFEAERQALALMDHPGIARVLDAGATGTGRPYFVMELVRGDPITEYCDANRLGMRERLELFTQVCHAVQHAHQKGIIHRDIKPSNILVTIVDGRPLPKIIDFGIAKATSARLTEKTLFTEHRQLIGTPEYMSPEQAEMSGIDIDTRTDIYSLGVLLYELVTGTTPFDARSLRSAAYSEIQRIIREVEPPKPSTRLSTLDGVGAVAERRCTEPAHLARLVRGDLDWIVMKCLEKHRARRYETANGLAVDVARHLAGEAVVAAPPGAWYRLRKAIRRHRVGATVCAAVGLTLVVGAAGTSVGFVRAAQGAMQARAERDKTEKIADFMDQMLEGAGPWAARGRDTALLRDLMDAAAGRVLAGELSAAPEAELRLRLTIGGVYKDIAERERAHEMLDGVEALARSIYPGDHERVASALAMAADLCASDENWEEALARFGESLAMQQRLHPGDHEKVAWQHLMIANCFRCLCRGDEALVSARAGLEMSRRLFTEDHPHVLRARYEEANALWEIGRTGEALSAFESLLPMQRRVHGSKSMEAVWSLACMGNCLLCLSRPAEAAGRFGEALDVARSVLLGDHPQIAGLLGNVAESMRRCGNLTEAATYARHGVEMCRAHPEWMLYDGGVDNEWTLARVLRDSGREAEAVESLRNLERATRERLAEGGKRFDGRVCSLDMLSWALLREGRPQGAAEAEMLLRECLELCEQEIPRGNVRAWLRYNTMSLLGETLRAQERFAEAEPFLVAGYEGLLADDPGMPEAVCFDFDFRREALAQVVLLYEAWDGAEPGKGHIKEAAGWRAVLEGRENKE